MSFERAAVRRWRATWRTRFAEACGRRREVWHEGYEGRALEFVAALGEGSVRVAELLGVGVLAQALDYRLSGQRYRRLTVEEAAFAKTYFPVATLNRVYVDEGARWTAGRLGIAYVFGYVIKVVGTPPLPLLMHELVHVRQFERWGWAYVAKALWAQHFGSGYRYGSRAPASSLNAEQEAAELEDRVRAQLGLPTRYRL